MTINKSPLSDSYWILTEPMYQQTAKIILGFLFCVGLFLYFVRQKNTHFQAAWASIKSWLFAAPFLLFIMGTPSPWPLVAVTALATAGAKNFFQMTGIYHRSFFVWICYLFIFFLAYCCYTQKSELYDLAPMILMGTISLVPIFRNNYHRMIQYMALTLMAFIFLGWSFLHLGKMLFWEKGVYIVLYIYLLTEISDNLTLAVGRFFGSIKPFPKINPRVSLEGIIVASVFTLILAWGMRHLLPNRSPEFWIASGLVVIITGRMGDLLLSVIRRDLGYKDVGVFILGRGDVLSRMDQLIFVTPIFYYVYMYLEKTSGS